DPHVAVGGPSELLQALQESVETGLRLWIARRRGHEDADAPHPLALLRARRERPRGCRAAEKRNELPPPHWLVPQSEDHGPSIAGLRVCPKTSGGITKFSGHEAD